ncbi:PEP-CTERM sorting domain-containing protein [Alteromonas sp. H39]|uniref:PEP-CTERM sorting domain-containing protein n=1 Tax=Alteromonas sp. H39 TaxID=3389876 RepID=UPI0039E0A90C
MKFIKSSILAVLLLSNSVATAGMITNGNFASDCTLNGWEQQGFGDINISGSPGNCAVNLSVNDTDFDAEIYQSVMFESGFDYQLTVDFDTSLLSNSDSFFISLLNDDFDLVDLLMPADISFSMQSNAFTINTDSLRDNYSNQNWSLSFLLYDELYDDFSTSTVAISNVSLSKVVNDVPAPAGMALFALGFIGLLASRRDVSLYRHANQIS